MQHENWSSLIQAADWCLLVPSILPEPIQTFPFKKMFYKSCKIFILSGASYSIEQKDKKTKAYLGSTKFDLSILHSGPGVSSSNRI